MNTKEFTKRSEETEEQFRERVEDFASTVATMAIQFKPDGSAEVKYFD